jgi:hypothetical protein
MSVAYITSELPEFTVDAANKMRPPWWQAWLGQKLCTIFKHQKTTAHTVDTIRSVKTRL